MNVYVFVLGTSYSLCEQELSHILKLAFPAHQFISKKNPLYICEIDQSPITLMKYLGGTIKIAQVIAPIESLTAEQIAKHIDIKGKILTFGISIFSQIKFPLAKLHDEIKTILKPKYQRIRYLVPQLGTQLSSIVIKKQAVSEYLLFENVGRWWIAKTLIFQDPESWNFRDYGRPYVAPEKGMLPPKVARMIVNLASSEMIRSSQEILLDPFCGMGTILAEALMVGWNVIGSDISVKAVEKAQKNLIWLKTHYPQMQGLKVNFFTQDATHISEKVNQHIDTIVTEPFLGVLFERHDDKIHLKGQLATISDVHNIFKGLEKLYLGMLRDWNKFIQNKSRIVIAFPQLEFYGREFTVKKVVDMCEKLGYTAVSGPFIYGRPQAVVKRQIYVFKKVKSS